jgi:hypothetical protein
MGDIGKEGRKLKVRMSSTIHIAQLLLEHCKSAGAFFGWFHREMKTHAIVCGIASFVSSLRAWSES